MFDEKRYIRERRKLIKEMKTLQIKRLEINRRIRSVQGDMNGWDRALITPED